MPIKILDETIASQIAAGEVVERPSSVVKELIENAIDSGAKAISISTREAGKLLVEVRDDGSGIPADELILALARHGTSKLSTTEDLFRIHSLGFRGEALASIGSVARLTLSSKTAEQEAGMRIQMDGGRVSAAEPVAAPKGSTVRVEDLFYNVPARLKFLKTNTTENRIITGLVTRYAIAYPKIRWELVQDDKLLFKTTGSGDQKEILQALFGSQDAKMMLPVQFQDRQISIDGFISSLSLTRSSRRDITLFVNGRWVQDTALSAAVMKAYATMLMVGRYPVAVLFVALPAELVDVNVHPAKAEVRFREPEAIFSAVQRAVRHALLAYAPIPDLNMANLWGRQAENTKFGLEANITNEKTEAPWPETHHGNEPQQQLPGERLPLLRLIGQVAATYLIAEGTDGLYLIDQHAAHERVLYDQLMAQVAATAIPSQALVEPAVVELSPEKAGVLEPQMPVLKRIGFDVEEFGPNTYIVRAMPSILKHGNAATALASLVESFEEDESPLQAEIEARIIARVCKRMAVKAGMILSDSEQKALLLDLESSRSPRTCPHGRPTMIHLSAALLERQFGRTGAI